MAYGGDGGLEPWLREKPWRSSTGFGAYFGLDGWQSVESPITWLDGMAEKVWMTRRSSYDSVRVSVWIGDILWKVRRFDGTKNFIE